MGTKQGNGKEKGKMARNRESWKEIGKSICDVSTKTLELDYYSPWRV